MEPQEEPRGPGRPPLVEGKRRTLYVYLGDEEHKDLAALALAREQKASELVREWIRRELRRSR